MRPMQIVEDPALRDWLQYVSGQAYMPPCRETIAALVHELGLAGIEPAATLMKTCLAERIPISIAGTHADP